MNESRDVKGKRRWLGASRLAVGLAIASALVAGAVRVDEAVADPPPQKVKYCVDTYPPNTRAVLLIMEGWVFTPNVSIWLDNVTPGHECVEVDKGKHPFLNINSLHGKELLDAYPSCCESLRFDCNADRCWRK